MEEACVDGPSGKKIQVLLVKPHGFDPAKKYPVIVNVHGGPQMQWADAFRGDAQVYPGAGLRRRLPEPARLDRLRPGLHRRDLGRLGRQGDEGRHRRGRTGSRVQPWVDKDRIGAMGWSWGGYAMMWLAGQRQPLQGARLDDGRLRPAGRCTR